MDARELLRRYLEQRRELGENELVLDSLSVDETLRILGAQRPGAAQSDRQAGAQAPRGEPRVSGAADAPVGGWREALRAAGAEPRAATPAAAPSTNLSQSDDRSIKPVDSSPTNEDVRLSPSRAAPANPPEHESAEIAPRGLVVGTASGELFGGSSNDLDSLAGVARAVASCTRCPLYSTATNPVPGEGSASAELVIVGEAPGATEDETGRPFVGAAGQLLTKILGAIQLAREDVFICNVLKHRPPGNRNPRPEEVTACSPFLVRQIELIRPKVLLALGTFAAQTLLETKLSIGKLRGQIHQYYGVPLIVTYHPAALLRNPSWKRPTWEDVQLARRILDRASPGA